jgi:subtilisin family serine protease
MARTRRTTASRKRKTAARGTSKTPRRGTRRRAESAFPDRIFALASPKSVGPVSLFEEGVLADASTVGNFVSETDDVVRAVNLLSDAGFEVLQAGPIVINIAGPKSLYESVFGTTLVAEERPVIKQQGIEDKATIIDTTDTPVSGLISTEGTRLGEVVEGVAIEEPAYLATPNMFPPSVDYFHLDVPADVSLGCNADRAHRGGITGRGVRVAMVDTGWQSHPWFLERGYRVDPVVLGPGTANANLDENGHGTGESANVFSTAPDCTLQPVKAATSAGALVNVTAAFNAAVALNPDIITNSWVSSIQFGPLSAAMQARAASVAAAWGSGIIVVFCAGNGHWGFPGQHPDVISVGGVDIQANGALRASDYASGFISNIYPGRRVPDVSGLVGMRPGAQSILLPLPEGCQLDVSLAGGAHPNGDETATNDGWAAFSGTSAATPQVAGVCALIRQACARLTPAEVRNILMVTARDVTTGTNHPNFNIAAVAGPDAATGNGLVDAHRAVLIAKLRCMSWPIFPLIPIRPLPPFAPIIPLPPISPAMPLLPFRPVLPFRPLLPFGPFQPLEPLRPLLPLLPFEPLQPLEPLRPLEPLVPIDPIRPIEPFVPFGPGPGPGPLSQEDIAALEQMIIESENPVL